MAAYIKENANDKFVTQTNNPVNFKTLVSKNYIREVNNIVFVFDQRTELWVVGNADFAFLTIPNVVRHERIWNLLKAKKTITGKYKATSKILPNTIELAVNQINDVILECANRNLQYKDLYKVFKDAYELPEYRLGD